MDALGVICARTGSLRVPRKAWAIVGGMSLVDQAIAAAGKSHLAMFIVATDDESVCRNDVPHIRLPREIADGPLIGTLQYVCERTHPCPSVIVTLQACIAFRQASPIDRTIDMLERCDLESAQTVVNVGWEHTPIYKPNGAVYATRMELIRRGHLWGPKHGMIVMSPEDSMNIDTPWDLRLAQALAQ